MAHVDDFIILGDERSQEWLDVVNAYCGVAVRERPGEILINQSSYCAQVEEVKFQARDEDLPANEDEKSQLRGVLGAVQWRAYSTAPQHLVQLSMLQSQVSAATVKVLKLANKLVREVFHNRHLGLRVTDLGVDPQDVVFVAFSEQTRSVEHWRIHHMCQQPHHFGGTAGSSDSNLLEEWTSSTSCKIFSCCGSTSGIRG